MDLDGQHVHAPPQQGGGYRETLQTAINDLINARGTVAFGREERFLGIVLGERQQVRLVA